MNMNKRMFSATLAASFILLCSTSSLKAQYRQNFGLVRPQPEATLPKGKAPFDIPVRKAKLAPVQGLKSAGDGVFMMNEGWEMADAQMALAGKGNLLSADYDASAWYNATVPGTVLTTLVQQGVYPDPYIGLNNMAIPDTLCRQDWWYRRTFETPKMPAGQRAWLHFEGINYKALFYLNSKLIGQTHGAFRRSTFDVTALLKSAAKNTLVVHILPPPNPGIPHEQSFASGMGPNGGQLALDGPTFISSEGWDWVPGIRDRNIGIWQDVSLKYTADVTIGDPQVITDLPLPDTTSADVTIRIPLQNHASVERSVTLRASFGNISVEQSVKLAPGASQTFSFSPATHPALRLRNPALWWPNGYGAQHLHQLRLSVTGSDGLESDRKSLRFGIREFSYDLMADAPQKPAWRFNYNPTDRADTMPPFDNVKRRAFEPRIFIPSIRPGVNTSSFTPLPDTTNPFLVVRVNGRRIFCKGGNWGMDDGMKNVSREKLEPYFKIHRHANYNMIRNWTGESTEAMFYDLADEYGMLVWNDFWMSTEGYNLNPLDQKLLLANTLDAIRRFRNHASIALWCPRNEGYAPEGIEEELYRQLLLEDGTRHYIGNSREINLRPSGDWHYIPDPSLYFTKYAEGFSTEIGTFSVPVATTIRKFIKQEDQWPINDVWHYHDLHSNNQNLPGYLRAVDSLYGKPTGLDDFSRKVQLVNYESHRAIFEGWNNKMWERGSGVLLWMTHPAWPSMIWQTYSWDGETHGSYFGSKKACEPVHVQLNRHDGKIVMVNATLGDMKGLRLEHTIYGLDGNRIQATSFSDISLPANDKQSRPAPAFDSTKLPAVYLVRLQLKDAGGRVLSVNEYWKARERGGDFKSFNALPDLPLKATKVGSSADRVVYRLQNPGKSPVVGIKLNLADAAGNLRLPALFSDGYFTLLPGESRTLEVECDHPEGLRLRTEAYNSSAVIHQ